MSRNKKPALPPYYRSNMVRRARYVERKYLRELKQKQKELCRESTDEQNKAEGEIRENTAEVQ